MRALFMSRRSSWIAVSVALAIAVVAALAQRARDREPADRGPPPAKPAAAALIPPAPPPADPPPAAPPPTAHRTPERQRVALRALELLAGAIASAEQRLDDARSAGDAAAVRHLAIELGRLRAARQQRVTALGLSTRPTGRP